MGGKSESNSESDIFYYHPDHLGSTAMVTDLGGHVTQNVVYIPYGEVFVEVAHFSEDNPDIYVIAPNNQTSYAVAYDNNCNIIDTSEYVMDVTIRVCR